MEPKPVTPKQQAARARENKKTLEHLAKQGNQKAKDALKKGGKK